MSAKEIRETKIGAGHASAMARLGLKELRSAAYPESNVAQPSEYGLYGTRTPGEVAEARRSDERDLEEEKPKDSIIDDRLQQAESRCDDRGEEKQMDRD
jgi:hypothetical protein